MLGDNNSGILDVNKLLSNNEFMNELKNVLIKAFGTINGVSYDKGSLYEQTGIHDIRTIQGSNGGYL